jgi:hypothetical protein
MLCGVAGAWRSWAGAGSGAGPGSWRLGPAGRGWGSPSPGHSTPRPAPRPASASRWCACPGAEPATSSCTSGCPGRPVLPAHCTVAIHRDAQSCAGERATGYQPPLVQCLAPGPRALPRVARCRPCPVHPCSAQRPGPPAPPPAPPAGGRLHPAPGDLLLRLPALRETEIYWVKRGMFRFNTNQLYL